MESDRLLVENRTPDKTTTRIDLAGAKIGVVGTDDLVPGDRWKLVVAGATAAAVPVPTAALLMSLGRDFMRKALYRIFTWAEIEPIYGQPGKESIAKATEARKTKQYRAFQDRE